MNPWSDQIKNSVAYTQAKELLRILSEVDTKKIDNLELDYINRAEVVTETVLQKLDNSDPRLVNKGALSKIGEHLSSAVSYTNNWVGGAEQSVLTSNLDGSIDNVVSFLARLTLNQDLPEAREAISSLRRTVARHRTVVEGLIKDLENKASNADSTIEEKLKTALAEFEKLGQQAINLDSKLGEIKNSAAQVSTEQQTAFTKAEADRSAAFTKLLSDKQKELEDSINEHKDIVANEITAIKDNVKADEEAAEKARIRVEEILGIVGEEALTGDYSNNARAERATANRWRLIAAGSITAAIIIAIFFTRSVDGNTPWQLVVAKVAIISSFGGLAAYAARQSSEHRKAQRNAESMALQLKALKPYLGDIEESQLRDRLLGDIADRLFGHRSLHTSKDSGNDDTTITAQQIIEALVSIIKRDKSQN